MNQAKAAIASWGRSFIAASAAVIMTGNTDPSAILGAGVAAILPVLIRFANPKDSSFGLGSK